MIGETLGHYRIESRLGAGGMGVVYLARDTHLHRDVALKILASQSVLDQTARDDLLREGRAASALNHPNICTVHEVTNAQGQMFMVMEYVQGAPLSAMIPPDGLPIEQTLRYGIQVADALEHAHERGVVHGDLKSANVIVTPEGRAKVLDFGLARRRLDVSRNETTQARGDREPYGAMAGTLAYMAPEILRGDVASVPTDIWALGVLLYEITAGKLPFQGTTTYDLSASILREPAGPLPVRVPPALRAIILRCLAKEPGERYRRAGEVRAALEAVDSTGGSTGAVNPAEIATIRRRRWPWGAAALAVLTVAGVWFWQRFAAPSLPDGTGRLTPLPLPEGRAFDPALSPDGKMVAYVAEASPGRFDLFVARVAGATPLQLTNDDAAEEHPRFSPDGEQIVFGRRRTGSTTMDVALISTLGGEIRTVVFAAGQPIWSPNGKRLAFIQRDPRDNVPVLAAAAIDGSDAGTLLRADGTYPFLRNPAWSPDGRQLAIVRSTGGIAAGIWLIPSGGGTPTKVSDDPPGSFSDDPIFAPDGRSIIYSSNRGGTTNIWVQPLSGRPAFRLTTGPGPDESPTIARDGTIAFVNSRWRNVLIVHDLETSATRSLVSFSPFIWAPAWSSDGSELAFSRGEADGSWHIWIVPAKGGSVRQLTNTALGEVYPRYLRDGSLLYHTWVAPHRIWRAAPDGGPPTAITEGPNDRFADVSPDGLSIAFVRAEAQAERIYVKPLAGGAARLLTASPGSVPRWSPDGRWIAFSGDRGYGRGIAIVAADGTGERKLTDRGGWPVWFPDGRHVGFRIIAADGNQQILKVPVEGGSPTPIDSLKFIGTNEPFDLWRDGRLIATTNAVHLADEILLMRRER